MKITLFVILFAFIFCDNLSKYLPLVNKKNEELIECVKEIGTENLKKLVAESQGERINILYYKKKSTLNEEDKLVFRECRKKVFFPELTDKSIQNKICL